MKVTFLKQKTPSDERWHGEEHFHIKNYLSETTPSQGKMHLKSALQKLNLLMAKAISKSYTQNCSQHCPCTFPHSYA